MSNVKFLYQIIKESVFSIGNINVSKNPIHVLVLNLRTKYALSPAVLIVA